MKKFLSVLIALLMVFALVACNNQTEPDPTPDEGDSGELEMPAVIRVGMECDYAPFNWTQAQSSDRAIPIAGGVGFADGYDVQIALALAEGMGAELEIVKIEWDGLTMAVQSGEIDFIIAGMSPLPERMETIDFSDAYYESELVIVVDKSSSFANASSLADFEGARITAQLNTFHETVVSQIPGVDQQVSMETFPAMIVALTSGAIDGYVSERPGAESAVAANPNLTFIEFAPGEGFEADPGDVQVCVGMAKGSPYRSIVNEILSTISIEDRNIMMNEAIANQPLSDV